MKQLKTFLLCLSCILFLPLTHGTGHGKLFPGRPQVVSAAEIAALPATPVTAHTLSHAFTSVRHYLLFKPEKLSHRTRALNDYHEQYIDVACFSVKSHFVYVQPHYKGYTESYISVSVSLRHWRGPPTA